MNNNFSKIDGKTLMRFAKATRRIETTPVNAKRSKAARDHNRSGEFWVEITGYDPASKLYSWKPLWFREVLGEHRSERADDWSGSEVYGWAMEIYGSEAVVIGSKLKVESTDSPSVYVFRYSPGIYHGYVEDPIPASDPGTVKANTGSTYVDVTARNIFSSDVGSSATPGDPVTVVIAYSEHAQEWFVIAEDCA